jgi:hypothetical protein
MFLTCNMTLLSKAITTLKTGEEPLTNDNKTLNFKLIDFWRWSVSDILSNATRGRFAEFIIATSTNIDIAKTVRDEWGPYDLITTEGIKLEVKSAAYLQSWEQKILSKISFSTKLTYNWDDKENKRSLIAQRQADIYVFCLLKHGDKQTINPLNLSHWEFYVLATKQLNDYTRSQHSITLNSLKKLTRAICYDQIDAEIKNKHLLNI